MKNKIYTIFLLGLSLLLLSTCKNPEIGYETFTITDESIEPEVYGAKVNGSFSFSGNVQEMKMKIATDESLTDATDYSTIVDNQTFSAEIEGLEPNTTYYYCYSINFGWKDDYLTDINSFTTLKGLPTVKTLEITALDASYRVKCEVTSDGGSNIMERGIYYWNWNNVDDPHPDTNKIIHNENGVGEYFCLMDNLEPNTTYYVRAYAKNSIGIGLAQVLPFETPDDSTDSLTIVIYCNPISGGTATGGGTFTYGQRCTITATANEGYAFTQWTENGNQVSTEASYTFTVDRNRNLVANFTENSLTTYNVTVSANPQEGGNVTGGGTFEEGQSCTVTATANSDYTFENWTENGSMVSTNTSYTFTLDRNRNLVANFTENPPTTYTISVSANPTNGGNVTGGGTFHQGQSCTVVATPAANYTFTNWTENGNVVSTNPNYTFTVNANRTLVANFTINTFTINVSANPSNGGNVSGGGTFNYGQNCTVTATAASSYTFTNWTENGSVVSTNPSYTFSVNANRTLVAHFAYNGGGNVPTGAINGVFSVSPTQQVYFSQGNLQYNTQGSHQCVDGTTQDGIWRFAPNQYDCIGYNNNNISATYSGWIDLFGWGTSGYQHGADSLLPWSTSQSANCYYAYGESDSDLDDHSGYADWGVYNTISNGSQNWRTLTHDEWNCILNEREASSLSGVPNARYAKAKVSDVNGLILFPDNYSHPNGIHLPNGINVSGTNYSVNEYNSSEWSQMEDNGCVFLPAAGSRNGPNVTTNSVGEYGYYWSSTHSNSSSVYVLYFDNSDLNTKPLSRYIGRSVRLVHPIP